ncbi:MAG: 30S ribosome-binding factor RbfA [Planctomycetes bacterium]|nr:30S ribosome-binding factor RbfA [Planctomycetota bacterium]
MKDGHIRERAREEIKRELSRIVEFETRDPLIQDAFPTVMDVTLSVDLRYAKVYVALGSPADKHAVLAAFKRNRGFFRSELARSLPLRYTPQLSFILDETVERSLRFEQLLQDESDAPRPN